MYRRPVIKIILSRLSEKRRFIQVLAGPRQTGKTTLARQVMETASLPIHYATADEPALKDRHWLEEQWEIGRLLGQGRKAVLILDEIQKIPGWSETVKRLWDEDSLKDLPLYVVLLGSSPLLVQQGLTESLAGRFEVIPITHWFLKEMQDAFGWSLDQYIYFGGYPGAAELIEDEQRWANYIQNSLVETSISRDILLMTRVDKPALLRRLFELGCQYSGRVLSYQKMLGQLQEAGNTTTLAHYLDLLSGAGLITSVPKYSGQKVRQRASSPKLQVLNTALMSVHSSQPFSGIRQKPDFWGRLVESSIGAYLANAIKGKRIELFYWLERNREVDFILVKGSNIIAIEVKSGRRRDNLPGIVAFSKLFKAKKKILVGADGIPIKEFLTTDPENLFN
jgi:predicted AAA+ superfamily ATPase